MQGFLSRSEGNYFISHRGNIAAYITTKQSENVWCKKFPNIFVGKYFKILFQNFDILIEFEAF